MKAILFQQDIIWADPEANRRKVGEALEGAPEADLVVLPEMFSTGFATKPEGIAEDEPCATLEWMKALAGKRDCAVAGSVAVREAGRYYNRFYFVKPDGSVTKYDKYHLFTYGGEDRTFTKGDGRTIVEWRGVRFLLAVCYDLRFPVWYRNRGDYDAVISVASWPSVRRFAWDTLQRARAIENQCFVLAVNRVGDDPSCKYNGGTVLLDPWGAEVAKCADGKEEYVAADIDMKRLEDFRKSFPVLQDADKFELK